MDRIIGFDLGEKTLGIAISDPLGITVRGIETFRFNENDFNKAVSHALKVINDENVNDVVIGYPLNMDGSISYMAVNVLNFKESLLKLKPSLNIILIDERLSTVSANRNLMEMNLSPKKRKEIIDMEAAIIILEMYLEKIKK